MATINPFQGPANYAVDVQSPFESALGGFKLGAGMAEVQAAQQKRDIELKALTEAQRRQTEIIDLYKNPKATIENFRPLLPFLPKEQALQIQSGFEAQTKQQQQETLDIGGRIYSALTSNKPDIAKSLLIQKAEGLRNSGREKEAASYDDAANFVDIDPVFARNTILSTMARLPGGEQYLKNVDQALGTIRAEGKAPAELKKAISDADKAVSEAITAQAQATNAPEKAAADAKRATADAEKARIESQYEEQKIKLGLRKTEEDIIINKENARIAALNAAQAKETNELRRAELKHKIDDATEKRDQADRDQKATLINQVADIDNFVNTATRIKQTPRDIINSATGPIASRLPTTNQDVADFESLVETLGSQAFLAQIPKIKGTGNLTEKEGDKLQASLQNLSLKQSPDRLLANVDEAVRLLEKSRTNITARSGLPAIPADVPARELNVTVGGVTYNFPTKAAADTFKNSDAYRRAAGTR
jgi:hypothetical protein